MSRPPRVSVGIPVYNGERFISEAIRSVIDQSFDDWELVISDNGSTDATPRICEELAAGDARIRFVRSPVNRGAAWNFNRVLRLSRGEYFKWLAADDYCAPEFLTTAISALEKSPAACLAYSPGTFVNERRESLFDSDRFRPSSGWPSDPNARTTTLIAHLFMDGRTAMNLVFGLIRRRNLCSVRPLGAYRAADFVLTAELASRHPIIELPHGLTCFRRHEGSSSWPETWNRWSQQSFYDPSISGSFRILVNHYRMYLELLRVACTTPQRPSRRAELLARTAYAEARLLLPSAVRQGRGVAAAAIRGSGRHNNDRPREGRRSGREKLSAS